MTRYCCDRMKSEHRGSHVIVDHFTFLLLGDVNDDDMIPVKTMIYYCPWCGKELAN